MIKKKKYFLNIVDNLKKFWKNKGCIIIEPIDISVGAGTFHHQTFFNILGKKNFSRAYIQPSRRPSDGRYSKNTNRLQHYYQFQVIIKPSPYNIQNLYLDSLKEIGINIEENDIQFIEDNWENPTLGACGIGWEIWINGTEITQFTYFQQMGGISCNPISVEITYGLERIVMHLQNIDSIYKIIWDEKNKEKTLYSDIFYDFEYQNSHYNFKDSNTELLLNLFNLHLLESQRLLLLNKYLPIPSYEHMLYATHYFNLLDCKNFLSTTDREYYISKIRLQSRKIAEHFLKKK